MFEYAVVSKGLIGSGAAAKSSDQFGRLAAICACHQQAGESCGEDAFSVVLLVSTIFLPSLNSISSDLG
jgi:hypothetical protein